MTKAKQKKGRKREREKKSLLASFHEIRTSMKSSSEGLTLKCDTWETSSQIKYQATPNFDLLMVTCSNYIILDLK